MRRCAFFFLKKNYPINKFELKFIKATFDYLNESKLIDLYYLNTKYKFTNESLIKYYVYKKFKSNNQYNKKIF